MTNQYHNNDSAERFKTIYYTRHVQRNMTNQYCGGADLISALNTPQHGETVGCVFVNETTSSNKLYDTAETMINQKEVINYN
jgi:hypothetical protein